MLSVGECIIATVSAFYQFGNSRVRVNRKYSEVKCLVSKLEFIKDQCCVHYCLS